jgi:hypothetical protein
MGVIGKKIGSWLGTKIGRFAGKRLGKFTGIGEEKGGETGRQIGDILGGLVPFKKGGPVRRKTKALLHAGEFVLPAGVKPTAKQVAAVRKRHRKKK